VAKNVPRFDFNVPIASRYIWGSMLARFALIVKDMTGPTEKRKGKKNLSALTCIKENGKYIYWSTGLYMTRTKASYQPKEGTTYSKKGKEQERKGRE
jgi:hypothetical protein